MDYYELAVKGIVTARKGPTGENTPDVEYHALVRDPIAAVGKVYDFFGQPLTADHDACMAKWLKSENPYDRNRVGQHNYDAASFGISSEELARPVRVSAGRRAVAILLSCAKNSSEARTF